MILSSRVVGVNLTSTDAIVTTEVMIKTISDTSIVFSLLLDAVPIDDADKQLTNFGLVWNFVVKLSVSHSALI